MWFDDWDTLQSIAVKAVIGFAVLVTLLRLGGKRTLAKFNAFDLVLTFTIGSVLATTIMSSRTTLSEGALAMAILVALNWIIAFTAIRSQTFRSIIKSDPTLLVYDGAYLRGNMRRERVDDVEVLAAMREHAVHDLKRVKAVILETEGEMSVLSRDDGDPVDSLRTSGIELPGKGESA